METRFVPSSKYDEVIQEVVMAPQGAMEQQLTLLNASQENWQPSDFIPELREEGWHERVKQLQKDSAAISDEVLVVLVGNLITEEALPSYQTWLNRFVMIRDETGTSLTPWAIWTRAWTAEENRHGDLLNRYLYLSGRVNMRAAEVSIQNLIRNGFDTQTGDDLYMACIYVSFQERATRVSHGNTAKLAQRDGDPLLHKICTAISKDEARHEMAYKNVMQKFVELDPEGTLIAFEQMLRKTIVMPGSRMEITQDDKLFNHFATVAQKCGIYTAKDYGEIISHLVQHWNIAHLKGLSAQASEAQEKLMHLSERYLSLAERLEERLARAPKVPFAWIFDRLT